MLNDESALLPVAERKQYDLPARYVLTFLIFCAMCLKHAQRTCLSVAIVEMVNQTAFYKENHDLHTDEACADSQTVALITVKEQGKYLWSPSIQGIILGAYFYGFLSSQAVGGRISEIAGGKWPLGISILASSLLTIITPFAADIGVITMITIRFMIGLLHGVCMPTAFAMFSHWAPLEEMNTLISFCVIGDHLGTVFAMPLAGFLCKYGFAGGWPSVFYVLGSLGCIWFVFWFCLIYNSPEENPRISKEELEFIKKGREHSTNDRKLPIPWKTIMSSLSVWSVVFAIFSAEWGYTTLMTKLPNYLKLILHYPIQKNGLINSLLYIVTCITTFLSGFASDYLRAKKYFSPTVVRKSFQTLGMMGPALCTSLIPLMGCNRTGIIALLTAAMSFQGLTGGGHVSIVADMAPYHSATLFGLVSGIGCTAGIFSPIVTGFILEGAHTSIHQWSMIFYISSGIYIGGGTIFLLFASAEKQSWTQAPD